MLFNDAAASKRPTASTSRASQSRSQQQASGFGAAWHRQRAGGPAPTTAQAAAAEMQQAERGQIMGRKGREPPQIPHPGHPRGMPVQHGGAGDAPSRHGERDCPCYGDTTPKGATLPGAERAARSLSAVSLETVTTANDPCSPRSTAAPGQPPAGTGARPRALLPAMQRAASPVHPALTPKEQQEERANLGSYS